jgi:hypothetical protein
MKASNVSLNKLSFTQSLPLHRPKLKLTLLALVIANLSGCSSLGVEPWERDLLAKKEMALTSSPIDSALDDHIYFSKEASSGGKSFGGGGCGCN